MKFFIDTASLAQIKEAQDLGVLDGVTTNPSLMAKEGISGTDAVMKHYVAICEIVEGDVSAEGDAAAHPEHHRLDLFPVEHQRRQIEAAQLVADAGDRKSVV